MRRGGQTAVRRIKLVEEQADAPKRRLLPLPRKKAKYLKRPRFYDKALPPDIDLMKPETLGGGFCGCGQRMVDGAWCQRCNFVDTAGEL